jgi:copper transporter 1
MLFTWSTHNLCIVFRSWHIRSTFSLIISLFLVVVLCAGYEAVRALSRRFDARALAIAKRSNTAPVTARKSRSWWSLLSLLAL